MANITSFKSDKIHQAYAGQSNIISVELDWTVTNVAAADTVDIADLPLGNIICKQFIVEVITKDGETATADFGLKPTTGSAFTADPNGLDDAVDLDATNNTKTAGAIGTDALMGDYVTATDGATLYMTADHALETGKIRVTLEYVLID